MNKREFKVGETYYFDEDRDGVYYGKRRTCVCKSLTGDPERPCVFTLWNRPLTPHVSRYVWEPMFEPTDKVVSPNGAGVIRAVYGPKTRRRTYKYLVVNLTTHELTDFFEHELTPILNATPYALPLLR